MLNEGKVLTLIKMREIIGKKFKEMKQRSQKFGRQNLGKTSEIEIWDRNCRNEFTGGKLREWNCRSEIQGRQNVGSQILKTIKGERKGELKDPPQKFELQMCECHQTINVFTALWNQRNANYLNGVKCNRGEN